MSNYQPRPYQTECIAALAKARENSIQKGLVVMASGLGKTLTAIFDLQQFLQNYPSAHILCLCHQENILLQSKSKFRKVFGEEYSYGMFTGTYKTTHPVNFLFATFQTMRDHREEFLPDAFDYIVVDEAHHTAAETYQPTADYFNPQFLLGLTATKDRMDGQNILDTYEQVLYQMDIYDGWNEGWLARVDYRIMLDDLNEEEFKKYVGPHATSEKVSLSQLNKTIFAPQHDEGIVASIREQIADLEDPSIFIFCSGIDHANAMAHQFGGEAAVIHSGQSAGLNEAILSEFRSGGIRIIVSVDMLNEGIDVPEADVVVFLRATESSTIFFQQLGRGLRTSGKKRTVRVLDYVANIERIATILEMEETARQRIPASPTYSPSANKPDPLVVNIPATKFKVQRADIEHFLARLNKRWSADEVIRTYYEASVSVGHWLTIEEIDDYDSLPSSVYITKVFSAMAELRKRTIQKYGRPKDFNHYYGRSGSRNAGDDELIDDYYRESLRLGRWLETDDINKSDSLPSISAFRNRFGNLTTLRQLVLEKYPQNGKLFLDPYRDWSDEQYIDGYYLESVKKGGWLTKAEIDASDALPGSMRYKTRFANMTTLRKKVQNKYGVDIFKKSDCYDGTYSNEDVLKLYHDASKAAGRWLSMPEVRLCKTLPSEALYLKRFGTPSGVIDATVEAYGDIYTPGSQMLNDPAVALYYEASRKSGHWLKAVEINKDNVLSSKIHARSHGGIKQLRLLAQKQYGSSLRK